jgi:D-alanyl-D-alanine dipeptidase
MWRETRRTVGDRVGQVGWLAVMLGLALAAGARAETEGPGVAAGEDRLVEVSGLAAGLRVELRYATANNFTKHIIYPPSARCYLRAPVAARLATVHRLLQAQGLGLKVYDCYRPRSAQSKLWEIVPDERFVANPKLGSRHNRGAAVDLTLVDKDGRELVMPTPYDDFTVKAYRSYRGGPAVALRNRDLLERAMVAQGFVAMPTEWWHFDDPDSKRYTLTDISFDELELRAR